MDTQRRRDLLGLLVFAVAIVVLMIMVIGIAVLHFAWSRGLDVLGGSGCGDGSGLSLC